MQCIITEFMSATIVLQENKKHASKNGAKCNLQNRSRIQITRKMTIRGVLKNIVGIDSPDKADQTILKFRHEYLRVLQTSMLSSHDQSLVKTSQNKSGEKDNPPSSFEIDLPTISSSKFTKIIVPHLLPSVAGHWGVAALFAWIDSSDLLLVLKLLLIERSVLVIGESTHIVTSCACALLELLKPYKWAGNLMPLLPGNMLPFVSSPVPSIIGMSVDNPNHSLEIENDPDVIDAMAGGLSVINLSTNSVRFTKEADIVKIIQGCPSPK